MKGYLWIAAGAAEGMIRDAEQQFPRESGGVLLGYRSDSGISVVVAATGPGPRARHTDTRYVPDAAYDQQQITEAFDATEGQVTYIGDWHSHSTGSGRLSHLDRKTLSRIANATDAFCPRPVMLIALRDTRTEWQLRAWEGSLVRLGFRRWLVAVSRQIRVVPIIPLEELLLGLSRKSR